MRNLLMTIAALLSTTAMVNATPTPVKKAHSKEVKATPPVKEVKKTPEQDTKTAPAKEVKATKHHKHDKKAKAAKTEAPKAETANVKK